MSVDRVDGKTVPASTCETAPPLFPTRLRTERMHDPLGIDHPRPRLSWWLDGPAGATYSGYQVQTSARGDFAELTWDSGFCNDAAPGTTYAGPTLESRQTVFWRVRAFAANDQPGQWSEPAKFEMGLIRDEDWKGDWIGIENDTPGKPIYLTTTIEIANRAPHGRIYLSALGWARVFIDDIDLTDGRLVPRFTPYDKEVEYTTLALPALEAGEHRVTLVVGDGRFRGALGLHGTRNVYGDRIGALAQLELQLTDGGILRAATDEAWSGGHGPREFADPKDGETINLDSTAGRSHQIAVPQRVVALPPHPRSLIAEMTPPMRETRRLSPQQLTTKGEGSVLVDFGQNFTGVVRLRATGKRGTRLSLQHAEDINARGDLEWKHLDREGAKRDDREHRFQKDEIVLGPSAQWVQPWFTYHGFRYVEISGLDQPLSADDIEGVVLSSVEVDESPFSSSDPDLNQLAHNVAWSMTGNFLDVPTDCPTRERGGFTGDAQIFAPTATMLADTYGFFRRYLRSLSLDQLPDGRVPMVIPGELSSFSGAPKGMAIKSAGSVGWGDAAVIIPWTLYQATGDARVLEEQYESMRRWIDYLHGGGARKGMIWGEWLRAGESTFRGSIRDNTTNRKNIGLAYFSYSARLLSLTAEVLHNSRDAEKYGTIAANATADWRANAVRRRGYRIGSDKQDDYVRALAFDLLAPEQTANAIRRLVELIEAADNHIGTGFLSTSMLLPALTQAGRADVALRLLRQKTSPSWLAQVRAGATTIWENWQEPSGKDGGRAGSSNHYAFGSVGGWLVSGLAGLLPATAGRRRIRFAPIVGEGMRSARGALHTDFGPVTAEWEVVDGGLLAQLAIPVGVEVEVGAGDSDTPMVLRSGAHTLRLEMTNST